MEELLIELIKSGAGNSLYGIMTMLLVLVSGIFHSKKQSKELKEIVNAINNKDSDTIIRSRYSVVGAIRTFEQVLTRCTMSMIITNHLIENKIDLEKNLRDVIANAILELKDKLKFSTPPGGIDISALLPVGLSDSTFDNVSNILFDNSKTQLDKIKQVGHKLNNISTNLINDIMDKLK